jgi:undecaprenyl-diphosphatase
MFVTLYLRRIISRRLLVVLSSASVFLWACLSSYSRIYLGLHYPGDILFGSLSGLLIGWLVFRLFIRVGNRLLNHLEEQSVVGLRELSPLLLPITFLLTLVFLSLLAL